MADLPQYTPPDTRPIARLELPWPPEWGNGTGTRIVDFYPVGDSKGGLASYLRRQLRSNPLAGDPRLWKGVYILLNVESQDVYVGSSDGASEQGRLQRTALRHTQRWTRSTDHYRGSTPGYTLPREWAGLALFPMPPRQVKGTSPRQLEDWLIRAVAAFCPVAETCNAVNQQVVARRRVSRAEQEYLEGLVAHYQRGEVEGAMLDADVGDIPF